MKKLLAAVTSIAMSSSLVTSAFATSITVSAAGGSSAVQPNVSMGEVMDGAVNKIAGQSDDFLVSQINSNKKADSATGNFETNPNFIVKGKEYKVKPGEELEVVFEVESGDSYASAFLAELDTLPAGITATLGDPACYADPDMHEWELYNGKSYQIKVLSKDGAHPVKLLDKDTSSEYNNDIIQLMVKIPEDIAPGEYEYNFKVFNVTEFGNAQDGHEQSMFNAALVPGKLIVEGDAPGTTTAPVTTAGTPATTAKSPTTTVQAPATTAKAPTTTANGSGNNIGGNFEINPNFIVKGKEYTVEPGEELEVVFEVESGDSYASAFLAELDTLPAGITATLGDPACYADPDMHEWELYNGKSYQIKVLSKDGAHPVKLLDKDTSSEYNNDIIQLMVKIPEDIAPGEYEYNFKVFNVTEFGNAQDGHEQSMFNATLVPGKLIVKGDAPGTTTAPVTTAKTPATTAKDTPTTAVPPVTTTPVNPAEGKAEWLIPEVPAKPGDTVTMQVIVNGASDLAVAGASYTVTVDSPIEFSGVSGQSDAYASAIVNNADTNEFAFGEKKGAGVTASDKAVIMTLTYKVPEGIADGRYPVKWSDAFVSDTNGLEITSNVTFTDGAIIVENEKFDGSIEWDIPDKVKAKPGDTVKMEVVVKDPESAGIPVAGAQFGISAESPIKFSTVDGTSAAYSSAIVNNAETNEFAFGENKGAGVAAKNGDNVLVLTYTVPEGTPGGEYAVTWGGDIYISDTNGNSLTEQIKLSNGSILVEDETFEGDIAWDIADKVPAKPGETVKVPVVVNVGDKNLPVAGAQFSISAETPIKYSSVDGTSAAYSAAIVNNASTNEFAFGHGKGEGVEAANGSNVLMLEYTVPAGTPAGEYAVTWDGDIYISDTNGNELTSQIKLLDGSILVEDDTVEGDIQWIIPEKHAKPGDTVTMDVEVKVGEKNLPVAGAQFGISAKTPIEFDSVGGNSAAYSAAIVNNAETNEFAFGHGKGEGIEAANGSFVLTLTYKVPEGTAAGRYDVTWSDAFISDTNGNEITSSIKLVPGAIIIDDVTTTAPVTTVTNPATTAKPVTTVTDPATTAKPVTTVTDPATTAKPVTTVTNPATTAKPVTTVPVTAPDGKIIWIIDEVDAAPGDEVKLNVLVNDSKGANLPIGGAQYIITETTPIEFVSASEKSEGYGANIVYNAETKEFAFADAKGAGVAATDGAVVMTLTYKVPEDCEEGRYPVTFGDTSFFNISSADGVDMSSQILTMDGAINVKKPVTTSVPPVTTVTDPATTTEPATTTAPVTTTAPPIAEGSVIWQGETVKAKPGEKVELSFIVSDPKDSKLPLGGANFIIGADGGITIVGATGSEGYNADIVYNEETNEYAFAHPKGTGVAAADGSKVITLTFDVPADIEPGKYPVTLSELFASDTNGYDITKNILVINGAIEVELPVTTTAPVTTNSTPTTTATTPTTATPPVTSTIADGAVIWQLDEAEGKPGEKVTLTMTILDPNDTKLAVGGGQFVIVTDPDLVAAAGTPYGAVLVYNPETNEFAFADANGNGVPSVDGTQMLTIDFTIPEDAVPGTEYPVEISEIVAISGNGDDITKSVFGMSGKIKVIAPDATTTAPVTTASVPTTTAEPITTASVPTTTAEPVTTASVPTTTAEPVTTASVPTTTAEPVTTASVPTTTAEPVTTVSVPTTTAEPVTTVSVPTTTAEPVTTDTTPTTTAEPVTTDTTPTTTAEPVTTDTTPTTTAEPVTTDTTPTTSKYVQPGTGTGTAPTTTKNPSVIIPNPSVSVTVIDGFYFSHDPKPFKTGHITSIEMNDVDGNPITPDESLFTFKEVKSGADNPEAAHDKTNETFAYKVNVYYNNVQLINTATGQPVQFTAYIGVKGDADLNNKSDAKDASLVLQYYAAMSTTPEEERGSLMINNPVLDKRFENEVLDQFAAFLVDVDLDVYSENNWKTMKSGRKIDANDASLVLAYYSHTSTGVEPHTAWNTVLVNTKNPEKSREILFNNYVESGATIPMPNAKSNEN